MIRRNPNDLLDVDAAPALPDDITATWAATLADPYGHAGPRTPPNKAVPLGRCPVAVLDEPERTP